MKCSYFLKSYSLGIRFLKQNIFTGSSVLKMEKDSVKSCCNSGKPKINTYVGKGTEINILPDLKIYQVGNGNKKGVILIYDIFGFDICQTRRFADLLAENSFNVVMPDFFRGKPYTIENFTSKNMDELLKWLNEFGSYTIVEKDLVLIRDHLQKTGAIEKPGILGFCWGGKMAAYACQTDLYNCGISVHGSGITPELINDVLVPMMFLSAGNDPPLDSVEELLNLKPVGKHCSFHRFDEMVHGFAAARGDWEDEKTRNCILTTISMCQNFLNRFLN